ncbi:hypothetical protein [Streptomyces sp. NPDC002994]|uniref:hypothetical protein n=1 Tax=Streptomyces sp. NPDC002994 TaxID=3154441 RepID=UPI0033B16CA4
MITFPLNFAEVPDGVAVLTARCMPPEVMEAEEAAFDAAVTVSRCRTPLTREARERALAEVARQNKILAAYNPGLIITAGGAS